MEISSQVKMADVYMAVTGMPNAKSAVQAMMDLVEKKYGIEGCREKMKELCEGRDSDDPEQILLYAAMAEGLEQLPNLKLH